MTELDFSGERVLPDTEHDLLQHGLLTLHQAIYGAIAGHCAGKRVLDIGCGTGHGTWMLAQQHPRAIRGVDASLEAVAYASHRYPALQPILAVCDALHLALPARSFDLVCAVEVIEHVPSQDRFLAEVCRVMRPGGTCFFSTPNRLTHSPGAERHTPANPFHVLEYTCSEFEQVLRPHFQHVQISCIVIHQRSFLARYQPHALKPSLPFPLAHLERHLSWHIPPWNQRRLAPNHVRFSPGDIPHCWGFLAICANPR